MSGLDSFIGKDKPFQTVQKAKSQDTSSSPRGTYRAKVIGVQTSEDYESGTPSGTIIAQILDIDIHQDLIAIAPHLHTFLPEARGLGVNIGDEVEVTWPSDGSLGTYRRVSSTHLTEDLSRDVELPIGWDYEEKNDGAVREQVPRFRARVGDQLLEGLNNVLVLLSRDRVDDVESGYLFGAGTLILSVGRTGPNLDFIQDSTSLIASQKTDIDARLNIDKLYPLLEDSPDEDHFASGSPGAGMRSTDLRFSSRESIKLQTDQDDSGKQGTIAITRNGSLLLDNKIARVEGSIQQDLLRITHKSSGGSLEIDRDGKISIDSPTSKTNITIDPSGRIEINQQGENRDITVNGANNVYLGEGSTKPLLLVEEFVNKVNQLVGELMAHTHPVAVDQTGSLAASKSASPMSVVSASGTSQTSPKLFIG